MGARRRAAAEQAAWVERWLGSDMTRREFAAQHGLSAAALSRWIRAHDGDGHAEYRRNVAEVRFVEIAGARAGQLEPSVPLRIELSAAVVLSFTELPDPEYVAAIARAVG